MEHATFTIVDERETGAKAPLTRYDDDAHAWVMEQAELLKAGRFADLDLIDLADEVADGGHREYDKLESDLARVIQHLLKWDHRPALRSRSRANSIEEHRKRVVRQLRKFPSLGSRQAEALEDAYERGRGDALIETGLPGGHCPKLILIRGTGSSPVPSIGPSRDGRAPSRA